MTPLNGHSLDISRGKRAETRIPFGALIEIGLISPGAVLYDAARPSRGARSAPTAAIASAGAQGSIHKIGAHVQGAAACNGWTFWHYEAEGTLKPIDDLREAARARLEPRGLTLHVQRVREDLAHHARQRRAVEVAWRNPAAGFRICGLGEPRR